MGTCVNFRLYLLIVLACLLGLGSVTDAVSDRYQAAINAYYQGRYAEAKAQLAHDFEESPDQVALLSSLCDLKSGALESAQASFSRVNLSQLHLGQYDTLLRLQFLLLNPALTGASLNRVLVESHTQIRSTRLSAKLSLQVADRLFQEHHYDLARETYEWVSQQNLSEVSIPALRKLIEIGILTQDASVSLSAYRALLRTSVSAFELDTLLGKMNAIFHQAWSIHGVLETPEAFLTFFRHRYDLQDYGPVDYYGRQFLTSFSDHSGVAEVRTTMAMCGFLTGRYAQAIPSYDAVITTYPGTYWARKSLFYKARCTQRLKQYEKAKSLFMDFIAQNPSGELAPEAYYYLYWCYECLNDVPGFAEVYKKFRPSLKSNQLLDQLIWHLAWDAYQHGRAQDAYDLLRYHPLGLATDDFKSRVLFWMGKIASSFNPEKSKFYFQKCILRYPLSYYSYRISQKHLPDELVTVSNKIRYTHLKPDPEAMRLVELGLGDWVIEDLQNQLNSARIKGPIAFTLGTIFFQQHRYYEAINAVSRSGISLNSQHIISKEMLRLLYPRPYWDTVVAHCKTYGVDPYLAVSLMREESLFNSQARSPVGALGLMQLMPETAAAIAKGIHVSWTGPDMALDPSYNIQFGVCYLADLKRPFKNNYALMLSGYNAGPYVTQKWATSIPEWDVDRFVATIPYSETNGYVTRVLKSYWIYRLLYN